MKYTSLSATAFAFVALVVAACAGGSEAPAQGAPGPSPLDAAATDDDGAKTCVGSCTSDSECASSCPKSSGTACCDLATKTCFKTKDAVCPKSDDGDAGNSPLPY